MIKMVFEHNTRCRTLHALAMTRTHQKSIPFLSKIVRDWSICQSRTHMSAIWSGLNRNREIHAFFRKSRSLTCPPSLPLAHHTNIDKNQAQTCIAVTISRRSAELKPGNQRFSPESSGFHPKIHPMGPALTNRPKIDKNGIADIVWCQLETTPWNLPGRRWSDRNRAMHTHCSHTSLLHCIFKFAIKTTP